MAHVLIIEFPGGNDADIATAALARGDSFSFLTSDLSIYQRQPAIAAVLAQAHAVLDVPGFDYAEVEGQVLNLHREWPVEAVLCLLDIRLVDAARMAQRLGLAHVGPAQAALLRDKFSVRVQLAAQGIAQPAFALATTTAELAAAVEAMGLPLVIKPSDGYASQNVAVLREHFDLDPVVSPLPDMLPAHADYGLGVRSNDRLVVERYMHGQVVGCDTFSVNGKHRLLGIHEKVFFDPPSFAIRGSCFSTQHPQFDRIAQYVQQVLTAVGFDWGACHVELMLTESGPMLIEINARLVGAKIARLVGYALNRSIYEDLIAIHLGQDPGDRRASDQPVFAVTRWIVATESGILDRVELADDPDPRIRCVEVLKSAGDYVRPPIENADRIGYFMVCAESAAQACALAEQRVAASRVVMV